MSKKRNIAFIVLPIVAAAVFGTATFFILNSRADNGFMLRKCYPDKVEKRFLRWRAKDYPLPVHVDKEWLPHFVSQAQWWNEKAGFELFAHPRAREFYSAPKDPAIVVESANVASHAVAKPMWVGPCVLRRVEIKMPSLASARRDIVARHELGHAIGLDHDPYEDWLMYRNYKFIGDHLSKEDVERIRQTAR